MSKPQLHFRETDQEFKYEIVDDKGAVIDHWYDGAHCDYPEDLTLSRMIGSLYHKIYEAGYDRGKTVVSNSSNPVAIQNLITAAQSLRTAQKAYMANRGNQVLGKAVAKAAIVLDEALSGVSK